MKRQKREMHLGLATDDIAWGEGGSRTGGSASARVGRASARTSRTVYVEHIPTKVRLEGAIEEGNYSKKEMKLLRDKLRKKLLNDLPAAVARKLRTPGR